MCIRDSLELRESAELRAQYETLRAQYGFRMLDYTVDSDALTPRTCFQFSEELAKRADFSPFVAVAGMDRPALSIEAKQLCVEGLKHGERYQMTLRAGLSMPPTTTNGEKSVRLLGSISENWKHARGDAESASTV